MKWKICTALRKLIIYCMLYLHKQAQFTWFLTHCCISLNSAAYFSGRAILMLQENILPGKTWNAVLSSRNSCMKQTFLKGFLLAGRQQWNILNFWFKKKKKVWTFDKKCTHFPKALSWAYCFLSPQNNLLSSFFSAWKLSAEFNSVVFSLNIVENALSRNLVAAETSCALW